MLNSISKIIIFIIAIFFVEESFLPRNSLIAKEVTSYIKNKPQNKFLLSSNTLLTVNSDRFYLKLSEDLNKSENKVLDLLVNNPTGEEEKFSVSIESQTQYEKDNVFYAEGNVVIYLSNARLEGEIASYDKAKKQFVIEDNVKYKKGSQYFEASKVFFDFAKDKGYIENIYGILDLRSFNDDFNLDSSYDTDYSSQYDNELSNLEYVTSATFGFVNDFEEDKRFNLTEIKFEVPEITKWRFKSDKIKISSNTIKSELIYFTNDAYNKPQFIFRSKKFRGEIIDDKLKLISRQSRLFFDDFLSIPIGKRTIFDKDPLTLWGIGSDYEEKDGFYISRGFGEVKIFDDYSLRLRPYFLIQRALKGKTNSFRDKDASILSSKVKNQKNSFLDIFAFDAELKKKFSSWDFNLKTKLNTLNTERLDEANRSKITLTKTIDLNEKSKNSYFESLEKEYSFINKIDLQFYGAYREKVIKGFSGDAEIYLAKGARIANRRTWNLNGKITDLSFIYDLGEYKAEKKNLTELDELFRHVFAVKYSYLFPIWEKQKSDTNINANYKYSPNVINQGISWITNIDSGIFLYSDGSTQEAISLSSGPKITIGSFTNSYFDYSNLEILAIYPIKGDDSPFIFDNIDSTTRIQFNFNQQLLGPLLFGYKAYLNLDSDSNEYGQIKDPTYSLDISRRAYSLGAFYKPSSESLGIQFNIFNFDYSGLSSKF